VALPYHSGGEHWEGKGVLNPESVEPSRNGLFGWGVLGGGQGSASFLGASSLDACHQGEELRQVRENLEEISETLICRSHQPGIGLQGRGRWRTQEKRKGTLTTPNRQEGKEKTNSATRRKSGKKGGKGVESQLREQVA